MDVEIDGVMMFAIFLIVILLVAGFVAGMLYGNSIKCSTNPDQTDRIDKLEGDLRACEEDLNMERGVIPR